MMKWPEKIIDTPQGRRKAVAPLVISASRATDIPAFYAEWFVNRLREGYCKWVNPFNGRPQYVSLANAQAVVFWSKNPRPMLAFLDEIERHVPAYYFQYTLNDYADEGLEPGVPPLTDRIATFRALSEKIGKDRVIWRFDPLVLTKRLTAQKLVERIECIGNQVAPFTEKLVFSFADIARYRKVQRNLQRAVVSCREFTNEEMFDTAEKIGRLCKGWNIAAATCAEEVDLAQFGITHNKCIDDDLILRITGRSPEICRLFGIDEGAQHDLFAGKRGPRKSPKDPGQRAACGCAPSKDIGQYNTCPHLCVYCYANASEDVVKKNYAASSPASETIAAIDK